MFWGIICGIMHAFFVSAAKDFRAVQKKVAELIKERILVGHALHNDLKVFHICFVVLLVVELENWPWDFDLDCLFSTGITTNASEEGPAGYLRVSTLSQVSVFPPLATMA